MSGQQTDAAEGSEPAASCARVGGASPATARFPKPTTTTLRNQQRVREAAARGLTRTQIAAETGLGYDRVKEIVRELGIAVARDKPGPTGKYAPPRLPDPRDRKGVVKRLCLCGCGNTFESRHAGERIAPKCRPTWSER